MTLPLLEPSPSETLAARCARLADTIGEYERDILGRVVLDLTAVRTTLEQAAVELDEAHAAGRRA